MRREVSGKENGRGPDGREAAEIKEERKRAWEAGAVRSKRSVICKLEAEAESCDVMGKRKPVDGAV
jgi:hypothetical protein